MLKIIALLRIFWMRIAAPYLRLRCAVRDTVRNSPPVRLLARYPLGERLLKDAFFRAQLSLYLGLLVNFLYGGAQLLVSCLYRSVWLGALAIYHILLAAIRFLLIKYSVRHIGRTDYPAELKQYRLCGASLFFLTPVLAGILILVVKKSLHAGYPGTLIYFAAVYTFCKIKISVSNIRKFKNCGSPVLSAAKEVSLISALISILTLETAVLFRYDNMQNPAFYHGMIGTVGGAVCLYTLGKAVSMILHATEKLKKERHTE